MHRSLLVAAALALFTSVSCGATARPAASREQPSVLEATSDKLDVRENGELRKSAWTLTEGLDPDIMEVPVEDKKSGSKVCLISGANELCRTVRIGEQHDFTIRHNGKTYPTRFTGVYRAPMAVFDAAYQARHRGEIRVDIPEVYELVNVAIALTEKAKEQTGLVFTDTPYHQELMAFFAPVREHPFVRALDQEMRKSLTRYFHLKMNGYAFVYGANGRIERSPVYDRTSFNGRPSNDLLPFLPLMQDFSDKSGFRRFFAAHRPFYQSQIDYYRNDIDLADMQAWLKAQFPAVKPYDTTNIIFSPLVAGSQSVTWMESNGFRELQPHVNFPYPAASDAELSKKALALRRGYIVFTELNHGFINPTADNYADRIDAALDHRAFWARLNSPSDGYDNALSVFNEMMNWALVSLYLIDRAPAPEQAKMIAALDPYMAERRGFPQFPAFNAFLVDLYRNRAPGTTVADLYPRIIDWFAAQDDSPKTVTTSESPNL